MTSHDRRVMEISGRPNVVRTARSKVKYGVFDLAYQSVIYLSLIRSTALPFQFVCRIHYLLAKLAKKVYAYILLKTQLFLTLHCWAFVTYYVYNKTGVYFMHSS